LAEAGCGTPVEGLDRKLEAPRRSCVRLNDSQESPTFDSLPVLSSRDIELLE